MNYLSYVMSFRMGKNNVVIIAAFVNIILCYLAICYEPAAIL